MKKYIAWSLVVSLCPSLALPKSVESDCVVADFRTLAFTVHNPTDRLAAATQWLQAHGDACSLKDMVSIKSSSSAWLGSADSPAIQQLMDRYYNAKAKISREDPLATAAAAQPGATTATSVVAAAAKTKAPAASAPASASSAAAASADAINTGITAAVAAAAASKAASSIAKTSAAK